MAANRVELHITLGVDGKLNVTGSIHDKMGCYAIMEMARDLIKDTNDAASRAKIIAPDPSDLAALSQSGPSNGGGR